MQAVKINGELYSKVLWTDNMQVIYGRYASDQRSWVRGEENSLDHNVKNSKEKLIKGVHLSGTIKPERNISKNDFK